MSTKPTVFIVDDDKDACDSVCALVKSMGVQAKPYASAEEFLYAYDASQPGCLITDLRMVGMSGLELQQKLAADRCEIPVIFISGFMQVNHAVQAMKAGAETVLKKPYLDQDLWDAIQSAIRLDAARCRKKAYDHGLFNRIATLERLEREVLDLVTSGKSNKVIAGILGISLRTVEDRRSKIMRKLGVESLAELVKFMIEVRHLSDSAH